MISSWEKMFHEMLILMGMCALFLAPLRVNRSVLMMFHNMLIPTGTKIPAYIRIKDLNTGCRRIYPIFS